MGANGLGQYRLVAVEVALIGVLAVVAGCGRQPETAVPVEWPQIRGYEAMRIPADNPMTVAKVELGKQLYYDTRLSGDGSRSCYSCHLQENGLTDGRPTAVGAYNVALPRSSPTLWNIGYHSEYYWDGRSNSLEAQARAAWAGGNMGATGQNGRPSLEDICARLNQIAGYRSQFQAVFGQEATPDNVVQAISAFERTLVANNSAWIRFREGNQSAISEQAQRGYQLFSGKAQCTNCHDGLLLTDLQYHNVGIGLTAPMPDLGRFRVTNMPSDRGAFKTPTLLDISKSAPYFHNGSVATLEEAVDLMLNGGIDNPDLDRTNLQAVRLTDAEKADLLAFLRSLDVEYDVTQPTLPQ
jgi:cytochrome c peroxidase